MGDRALGKGSVVPPPLTCLEDKEGTTSGKCVCECLPEYVSSLTAAGLGQEQHPGPGFGPPAAGHGCPFGHYPAPGGSSPLQPAVPAPGIPGHAEPLFPHSTVGKY